LDVDNRSAPARSEDVVVAVVRCGRDADSNRRAPRVRAL